MVTSHEDLGHDIETEHRSHDIPELIFHESPVFRSGDETGLQVIRDFITERTGTKAPESTRLDAIWVCISIPDTTDRMVDGEVKEVLYMGKVPVVVVFTKFDEIVCAVKSDYDTDDATKSQSALDVAHEQYEKLCRSLFGKDPGDLPAVKVSVKPEYVDLIEQLIKVTDKRITDSRIPPPLFGIEESEMDSGEDYETDSTIGNDLERDDVALSTPQRFPLRDIFYGDRQDILRSIEAGKALRSQDNGTNDLRAQTIIAGIISYVQANDDGWVTLAADHLGRSEDTIRAYLKHDKDNVLLANLIHITRQIIHGLGDLPSAAYRSSRFLTAFTKFDIQNTLPELQRDFIVLWDEINRDTQNRNLKRISNSLCGLHEVLTRGDHLLPGRDVS
ncbi:hypothetical protein BGW80DRAFT_376133 [Lactifluus volemus]|nr:hypothetical protein BGW80DRAFT_376133 [Lactifluus volemus]